MNGNGRVVIVGTGHAGVQAAVSLRNDGYAGSVTIVGDEPDVPYERPPLSKRYLASDATAEQIHLHPAGSYAARGIGLRLGEPASALDLDDRAVILASGARLPYDHLVLATGARARSLPVPGAHLDGVMTLRGLADATRLRERIRRADRIVIVGGGLIGLEVAATARRLGCPVTVVESGKQVMPRLAAADVAQAFQAEHETNGTTFALGVTVTRLRGNARNEVCAVETADDRHISADLVLIAVGTEPRTALARDAGIIVNGGVTVDEYLSTSDAAVSAIGDCADLSFADTAAPLGRMETVHTGATQAQSVARKLTGRASRYSTVPWSWSEQHTLRLQIAGHTDGCDETRLSGNPESRSFSVLFFTEGTLRGVQSVNRPRDHAAARRVLARPGSITTRDAAAAGDFTLQEHR